METREGRERKGCGYGTTIAGAVEKMTVVGGGWASWLKLAGWDKNAAPNESDESRRIWEVGGGGFDSLQRC